MTHQLDRLEHTDQTTNRPPSVSHERLQLKQHLAGMSYEEQIKAIQPPMPVQLGSVEPVQMATTTGKDLTTTDEDVGEDLAETWKSFLADNAYPKMPKDAKYPPPKKPGDIQSRLLNYGCKPKEKEWLYKVSKLSGVIRLLHECRPSEEDPTVSRLDPQRATVVAWGLSQVGLVEAHRSVVDPNDSKKRVRYGIEHLNQYHIKGGKGPLKGAQLDPRVKVGPAGKNMLPSWCQLFAKWVVTEGGGTFTGGNPAHQIDVPEPGDVAYMQGKNHMAVVVSVDGQNITTVDGNIGANSQILVVTRNIKLWTNKFFNSFP